MCCGGDMLNLVGERMPLGGDTMGGIKLFGQTISVTQNHTGAGADAEVRLSAGPVGNAAVTYRQEWTEIEGVVEKPISARSSSGDGYLQPPQSSKLATTEYVGSRFSDASSEGGQSEGDHSQSVGNDKNNLPKPDKVVACPRCDSFDTKFCYYNNYNVNQPRHFCKNCQRYWTAGGTLRNVPVGAGRRKNKHGGGGGGALQQRESGADASASTLFSGPLGSPPSQKGVSFKQSQPKRMAGQSSPMRSPGSVSSFGQESGITTSSPLQQNGRLAFQPFASSQGFMSAGIEASAVGSSDSGSTLHQRLQRFPSGHGFDKDCGRSSLSGLMQDAPNLSAFTQQQESSCRPIAASSDMTSGWAGSDGPGGSFNGEYPNGYYLEWSGKHSLAASQGVAPFSTPARSSYNPTGLTPTWSWNSHLQNTTLGKRGAPDGGSQMPALGLDGYSRSLKSKWPMLGRNPSDVSATMKLFQPKLESEQKDSFMVRPFLNSAAARPGSYPVTI